ncbi:MAG: EAL domain-containing protein [Sphingomonadales bacterium]
METLKNIAIVLSYAIIGVAVVLLLPALFGVDRLIAIISGFVAFISAAQLHGVYSRRLERADIENELFELHQDHEQTIRELNTVRANLAEISDKVEFRHDVHSEKIIAEMKVLEGLLAQVASKSKRRTMRAASVDMPDADAFDDVEILSIMQEALRDNRVDLYLQPIVSLPQRRMRHYEAFSRVRNEDGNVIYPRQFLSVTEGAGLVGALDNLLLFRCIQVIRQLRNRRANFRFFCNISAESLRDQDFFPQFLDFMRENQDMAGRLVFEFPQADIDDMDDDFGAGLEALGQLGYQFSVDHVEHLRLDLKDLAAKNFKFVKIPAKIFTAGIGDIHSGDLKEALNRYSIDLIVEYIEDEQMLVDVLDSNVDFGQGYLFGEPRPSQAEARTTGEIGG